MKHVVQTFPMPRLRLCHVILALPLSDRCTLHTMTLHVRTQTRVLAQLSMHLWMPKLSYNTATTMCSIAWQTLQVPLLQR